MPSSMATQDGEPEVLIAKDEESLNQAVALELIATTAPHRVGIHLTEIRDALMDGRWADALVAWMSATGRIVDVYPDEPIQESVHDEESIKLEMTAQADLHCSTRPKG